MQIAAVGWMIDTVDFKRYFVSIRKLRLDEGSLLISCRWILRIFSLPYLIHQYILDLLVLNPQIKIETKIGVNP